MVFPFGGGFGGIFGVGGVWFFGPMEAPWEPWFRGFFGKGYWVKGDFKIFPKFGILG